MKKREFVLKTFLATICIDVAFVMFIAFIDLAEDMNITYFRSIVVWVGIAVVTVISFVFMYLWYQEQEKKKNSPNPMEEELLKGRIKVELKDQYSSYSRAIEQLEKIAEFNATVVGDNEVEIWMRILESDEEILLEKISMAETTMRYNKL